MSEVRTFLARAMNRAAQQPRTGRLSDVDHRIAVLEAELQEQRQLNRRIAELTDVVAELLVPLARHDQAAVDGILVRYRGSI